MIDSSELRERDNLATAGLVVLLIALGCYRLSLIDRGHFFWGDERRFLGAETLVDRWAGGDFIGGLRCLQGVDVEHDPYGRPMSVLINVSLVLAQRSLGPLLGMEPGSLRSYDIVSVFNVIVSLAVTLCIFVLGRRWTASSAYGLLIALVHGLMCNANVWIRHLLPYNVALLLFLLALVVVTAPRRMATKPLSGAVVAGILAALGFTTYTGYYAFVLIIVTVLCALSHDRLKCLLVFGASALGVLSVFDFLARLTGGSWIRDLGVGGTLGGGVAMGHYEEGYVFVWHYLRDVEGLVGVGLFGLFLGGCVAYLWRPRVALSPGVRAGLLAAIACYLLHATLGAAFHTVVFYGRILGMYLPFLVIGAVLAVTKIPRPHSRVVGAFGLLVLSLGSFADFARSYARISYPGDLLLDALTVHDPNTKYPPELLWGSVGGDANSIEEVSDQWAMVSDARPEGTETAVFHLASHAEAAEGDVRFIGVNFKWVFYYRQRYEPFVPPEGYHVAVEALGPLSLPATGYEAYKPWERRRLVQRQFTIRIYERDDRGLAEAQHHDVRLVNAIVE